MSDHTPEDALGDREVFPELPHIEQWRHALRRQIGHTGSAASWYKKQLTCCRTPTGCSLGTAREHRLGITSSQRGWNGHPGGRLNGCGSAPAITGNAVRVSP